MKNVDDVLTNTDCHVNKYKFIPEPGDVTEGWQKLLGNEYARLGADHPDIILVYDVKRGVPKCIWCADPYKLSMEHSLVRICIERVP